MKKRTHLALFFLIYIILGCAGPISVAKAELLFISSEHSASVYSEGTFIGDPEWSFSDVQTFFSPNLTPAFAEVDLDNRSGYEGYANDGTARAAAWQSPIGINSVLAEYHFGDMASSKNTAHAQYIVTFKNDAPDPMDFSFEYFITGGSLVLTDPSKKIMTSDDAPYATVRASFSIQKEFDPSPFGSLWAYEASLQGGTGSVGTSNPDSWELTSELFADSFGMADMPTVTVTPTETAIYASILPYEGVLNLGTLQPGEMATAIYSLYAEAAGPAWGIGAMASIGDPYDFNSGGNGTYKSWVEGPFPVDGGSSAVPEPATMALFSTGLLGIFFRKRFV